MSAFSVMGDSVVMTGVDQLNVQEIMVFGLLPGTVYSRPPQLQYRRSRDRQKSGGIRKPAVKGVIIYNPEKNLLGLENGRRYWGKVVLGEGGQQRGGIGEAVNGGRY